MCNKHRFNPDKSALTETKVIESMARTAVPILDGNDVTLLAPISGILPTGDDPRNNAGAAVALYRQLRDARNAARRDERQLEAAEGTSGTMTLSPSWREVIDLSVRITTESAKDIEVLAWLTEAETRIGGHAGLAASLGLIRAMTDRFGADLHPRPEDAGDDPFAALAGLNGIGREGALIQPLRLIPLVPGSGWGENSLWTAFDTPDDLGAAMAAAGPAAMAQMLVDVQAAQSELDALDQLLTERLGGSAPPMAQIREVLADTGRCIRRLANLPETVVAESLAQSSASETAFGGGPALNQPATSGPITSREEAFAQLLRISAYFRRAEPHSPIGFALETLVRRGRMDFLTLLRELVPDDSARETFMTNAGISHPEADEPQP